MPRVFPLLLILLAACASEQPTYTVVVDAGTHDRHHTLTSFDVPGELSGEVLSLIDDAGHEIPAQTGPEGRAWFILDSLSAGNTRTYRVRSDGREPMEGVELEQTNGRVTFATEDQPVLSYQVEPALPRADIPPIYERGGYIHPVHTPSGRLVTDDYPPDHVHHHGIWTAWTNTMFQGRRPDFWNMGDSTGTVEPVVLDRTWSGPVFAGLHARHRYVDLSATEPVTALHETWDVRVYPRRDGDRTYHVFDLAVTQLTATEDTLFLPEYRYGGVGFRGHRQWNGEANAFFLTSEGRDRSDGHATRARWCHVSGFVDGQQAGVAILGHPDNYEAPQPMRIHPDEPFFNFAPSQAGDWAIVPGVPYVARYRYVVADGPPDPALLDRLWTDYADPPTARVDVAP